MPGYSGTPLVKKLGLKPAMRVQIIGAPVPYAELVPDLPEPLTMLSRAGRELDFIHAFVLSKAKLAAALPLFRTRIRDDGMIWISWPKKSAKVPTDVTEDVIRDLALRNDLVDVKVCAVTEVWSGLRLVIPTSSRGAQERARKALARSAPAATRARSRRGSP